MRMIQMKLRNFKALALASIFGTCLSIAQQPSQQPQATPAPQSKAPDIATMIAFMQPSSVVLSVGNMTLTWQQMSPIVTRLLAPKPGTQSGLKPEQAQKKLRKLLQDCAQRGLLLQEANSLKLAATKEEQLAYEKQLEQSLIGNRKGMTKEKVLKSFSQRGSTMLRLSYPDALKLMKLDSIKFADIEITKEQISQSIKYIEAVNKGLKKQNDLKKNALVKLMSDPKNHTKKGFENVVREYSEGVESKWGGELKYDFTRDELAAVCYLDRFDFKVGDVTPVCETNAAFRVIRVLREVPQKEGQPKLRVAQILAGKLPVQSVSEQAVTARLKLEMHKYKLAQFIQELARKYPVKSIFFPAGLWQQDAGRR